MLAHYRGEDGCERVQEIFDQAEAVIRIASPTITEFARRMRALGESPDKILASLKGYGRMWKEIVSVDEAIAVEAFLIGQATRERLPLVDALIAGAARITGSVLVHRDPHFKKVSTEVVLQENLEALKS